MADRDTEALQTCPLAARSVADSNPLSNYNLVHVAATAGILLVKGQSEQIANYQIGFRANQLCCLAGWLVGWLDASGTGGTLE